jgi:hypothetical protein
LNSDPITQNHNTVRPVKAEVLLEMEQVALEAHLTSVYKAIAGDSKVSNEQRVAALEYLQTLATNTQVTLVTSVWHPCYV